EECVEVFLGGEEIVRSKHGQVINTLSGDLLCLADGAAGAGLADPSHDGDGAVDLRINNRYRADLLFVGKEGKSPHGSVGEDSIDPGIDNLMRVCDSLAVVGSMQFGISGPLDCHVYAVRGREAAVLIDSGSGTHTVQLLRNLGRDFPGLPVSALLITHCHAGHCGSAAGLRTKTGCRVLTPLSTRAALETGDEEMSGLRVAREQGV